MSSSNNAGSIPSATATGRDVWQSTRAQTATATQFLEEADDYLAPEPHDIGRLTGVDVRELFVSCDPALAMQLQFEHLKPDFIAIHEIATTSSRKLLAGLAAASARAVQRLVIRRQGQGTPLATIEFVELPTANGSPLRMYSTEVDADTAARHGLARVLLAFSRLGVIMFGNLPGHAVASALKPFQEFIASGPWPNRELLLLPLASGSSLAAHGAELARASGLNVRTAPQVTRPADAWGFIDGSWSRLRDQAQTEGRQVPPLASSGAGRAPLPAAPGAPFEMQRLPDVPALRPMPVLPSAAMPLASPKNPLERYVQQLSELPGVTSCCVFDVSSGLALHHAGASPGAADLALHGKALLNTMTASSRALGLGHALPEAAITLVSHHLLLRAMPRHPGLALHAALDKAHVNLTLARLQIQRLDAVFDEPAGV